MHPGGIEEEGHRVEEMIACSLNVSVGETLTKRRAMSATMSVDEMLTCVFVAAEEREHEGSWAFK